MTPHNFLTTSSSSLLCRLQPELVVTNNLLDLPPPSPPKPKTIVLPPNWKTARDPEGKIYYYHVVTRWVLTWLSPSVTSSGLCGPSGMGAPPLPRDTPFHEGVFPISNLNIPWHDLRPFPCVLSLVFWEESPAPTSIGRNTIFSIFFLHLSHRFWKEPGFASIPVNLPGIKMNLKLLKKDLF